jgi:hypothetical protein
MRHSSGGSAPGYTTNLPRRAACLLFLALLAAAPEALGFRPDARSPLPDFDRRPALAAAAALNTAIPAQNPLPGVRVDRDALGRPAFVRARAGFLTGPDGAGGTVSAVPAGLAPADPHRGLKAFLQENRALFGHGPEALAEARVTREFETPHSGMRSTVWQQQVDGVPVFEAVLSAHTTRRGELVNIGGRFLPDPRAAAARGTPNRATLLAALPIAPARAVANAAAAVGLPLTQAEVITLSGAGPDAERRQRFTAPGLSSETRCSLVWLPVDGSSLRLCWDVILTSRERGEMFRMLIDAETGETWLRRCLTVYATPASYNVYTSDSPTPFSPGLQSVGTYQPPEVSRTLVTLSALSTNASPAGWLADGANTTMGNNVDAHLDKDADDTADPGSRPVGAPFRVFDCSMDLAQAPSTYGPAAVVQLFYLNNWMHDRLYELGFTEAAGNFQVNNFGRGGSGNDAVQADAQDGSGTDNANFSTPPDGAPPRMQMYVFTGPSPDRDGDFDAEIVLHEYTHGLSGRRVGGGVGISTLQAGGLGEGWSDFYPLCLLGEEGDDPRACYASGGYATYQFYGLTQNFYFGIRRYPYSTDLNKNPLTFKDIDPAQADPHGTVPQSPMGGGSADEVHNMGEVWCVTLWEARANLIEKHGWQAGNTLMLQLVTDGMALCPANPNFLQARDAILQADEVAAGGANFIELWTAFAKRGMGFSATSPDSSATEGLQEAYDLPDDLLLSPATGWSCSGYEGGPFSPTSSLYSLQNIGAATLSWTASSSAGWLSVSPAGGTLVPEATASAQASLAAAAALLTPGSYSATLTFRNTTSGRSQRVTVSLTVKEIPGQISATDSILPAQDGQLPFGAVDPAGARREQVVVTNLSLTYDLLISGLGFGFYSEDFNDGLAQNWTPNLAVYWAATNGEYRAQSASLDRLMQSTYQGEKWSDCSVRFKIRRTGSGDNAGVIALRATDTFSWSAGKGAAYMIGTAGYGYYYVGKYVDGSFSMIQSWSVSPYLDNSENVIEVRIQGNQISVLFNDEPVFAGTDDSIPGPGRISLMGYSGYVNKTAYYFDDVNVSLIPESEPLRLSAEQQWYNGHACPGGSPLTAPETRTVPAYPGGGTLSAIPSFTSVKNGPFQIMNAPDLPCRLKPGEGFVFDLAFQPVGQTTNINTLVIRSNDAATPEVQIQLTGEGGFSGLAVSPAGGLTLRGRTGGPFPSSRGTYTLTNSGTTELVWEATDAPVWLAVEPSEGLLMPGASLCATLSVNQAAADLPDGVYSNTLVFRNLSVYSALTRSVHLLINKYPRIELAPASFGVTNIAGSRTACNLMVGNPGEADLLWSLRLPNDILLDDFENGASGWTTSGVNNRWNITTNRSASGSQAWYCGNPTNRLYVNYINAYLTSPPLALGAGATLAFDHWYLTETNFDAGYVDISTNNGTTYATLDAFTGSAAAWSNKTVDLSAYSGMTARIRFRFKSNALTVAEGWYIDNITIQPLGVASGNVVAASAVLGSVPAGGSTNLVVTFDAGGLAPGQIRDGWLSMLSNDPDVPVFDMPFLIRIVKPITVTVPALAVEGAGLLAEQGRIILPEPLDADLPVALVSSAPEKAAVPAGVVVAAGSTQAVFDVTVGDDRIIDGPRAVTIAALTEGYGIATILVHDNESTNLTLTLPAGGYEGTVWTNGGRITMGGEWPGPLTLTLSSSDATEMAVPATVTIPKGQTSAIFTVSLPADSLTDGAQTAQVTVAAAALSPATASVVVRDRDLHHFSMGAIATPQSAGTPSPFTVTALDVNGEPIGVYNETATLSATGKTGALRLQPTNILFVDGIWAGPLQINKPDKNVRLTAQAGPIAAQSALFEVVLGPVDHFAWSPVPSPQNVNYAFPVSITAQDAANNTVTGFAGTVTLAGYAGENGDGSPLRVTPTNSTKFVKGVWKGSMTVRDNTENMRLKAIDKNTRSGLSGALRVGPLSLVLKLPGAVYENNGILANAGTVTLSRILSTNAILTLRSANTAELRVPARITVPAGKASVAFSLTVVNDGIADGPQTAAVTASLQGYLSATAPVEVRPEAVQTPLLAPAGGKFEGGRLVALSCATPGSQIRYTRDGSEVTESSPLYEGAALPVTNSCTIKIRAFKPTATPSATVEGIFERVAVTAVQNGVALTGLSAGPLQARYFRIEVPEFCTNLLVAIGGGDGECDLLLRHEGIPGSAAYDYYPALAGNTESVSIRNPPAGVWYALLLAGPEGFSDVRLDVSWLVDIPAVADPLITPAGGIKFNSVLVGLQCATAGAVIRYTLDGTAPTADSPAYSAPIKIGPTALKTVSAKASRAGQPDSDTVSAAYTVVEKLTAGVALTASGKQDQLAYFALQAPAGSKQLTVTLTGGTGDGNLYVRKGKLPTKLLFDRGSIQAGNHELVILPNPAAATWYYILVYGKTDYKGASLKATIP